MQVVGGLHLCLYILSFINERVNLYLFLCFALMILDNESEEIQFGGNKCVSQVLFLLSVCCHCDHSRA